jgi:formate-dependent nitrite reductase membrane component NrfD
MIVTCEVLEVLEILLFLYGVALGAFLGYMLNKKG